MTNLHDIYKDYITNYRIIEKLWYNDSLSEQIKEIVLDGKFLSQFLERQVLSEQIDFLQFIYGRNRKIKNEEYLIKYLEKEFEEEPSMYSISELANDYDLDEIVMQTAQELKEEYEYDERWNEATEEQFIEELTQRVKKSFYEVCCSNVQDMVSDLYCELPDELYQQIEYPEVGEWSFDEKEIKEVVLRYIGYVYNTHEEDYTYYKKYIYDPQLLNNSTEEELEINALFRNKD